MWSCQIILNAFKQSKIRVTVENTRQNFKKHILFNFSDFRTFFVYIGRILGLFSRVHEKNIQKFWKTHVTYQWSAVNQFQCSAYDLSFFLIDFVWFSTKPFKTLKWAPYHKSISSVHSIDCWQLTITQQVALI